MLQRIFQRITRCLDVHGPENVMRKADEFGFRVLSGRLGFSWECRRAAELQHERCSTVTLMNVCQIYTSKGDR
jgi:hypothetical protein